MVVIYDVSELMEIPLQNLHIYHVEAYSTVPLTLWHLMSETLDSVMLKMPNIRYRLHPFNGLLTHLSFKFQSSECYTGHIISVPKG